MPRFGGSAWTWAVFVALLGLITIIYPPPRKESQVNDSRAQIAHHSLVSVAFAASQHAALGYRLLNDLTFTRVSYKELQATIGELDRLAFASLPLALDIGSGLEITAYSSVELQRSLIQLDSLATLLMYDGGTRAAHAHRAIKTLNDPAAPLHNRTWAEYKLRKAILGWNESLPETLNEAKNSLSEVFRQCQVIQNQLKDAVAQVPKLRSLLGLKRQAEWIEWNAETIQKADAYKKYWSRLLDFLSLRLEATSRLTEAVARASDSTDVYRLAPIFNSLEDHLGQRDLQALDPISVAGYLEMMRVPLQGMLRIWTELYDEPETWPEMY